MEHQSPSHKEPLPLPSGNPAGTTPLCPAPPPFCGHLLRPARGCPQQGHLPLMALSRPTWLPSHTPAAHISLATHLPGELMGPLVLGTQTQPPTSRPAQPRQDGPRGH